MLTEKQLTKTSKTLSYLLRHKPEEANLKPDKSGWVDVGDLILNTGLTIEMLDEVIENNNKKRFELSLDRKKIRARQGHSIEVDLGYDSVEPPEQLFHGTVESARIIVQREGLRKMGRHHVHLSPDIKTAKNVGGRRGKPVILVIDAARMYKDGYKFYHTENDVWLVDEVPPKYISKA